MEALLVASLTVPAVFFTVAVGVAACYWLFVVLGVVGPDLFDGLGGTDLSEGGSGQAEAGPAPQGLAGLWGLACVRGVPLTVGWSLMALLGWGLCVAFERRLGPLALGLTPRWLWQLGVAIVAFAGARVGAGWLARPLAPLFAVEHAPAKAGLVGRRAAITSRQVDRVHGEAEVDGDGAAIRVQVRADPAQGLVRGDRALLLAYDAARDLFEVVRSPLA